MLSIYIGGVDRTEYVSFDSLGISSAINQRSDASFDIIDEAGTYRPNVGDVVGIYDGATLKWAGTIDDLPEIVLKGTSALKYSGVPIVDYCQIADRLLVAESYEAQTAGYIVGDIITKYLAGEGVTAGTVQAGVTITKAVFNYMTASACLDELSELTGFQWRINPDKTLDFFDRTTYIGTAITDTSDKRNVKIKRNRQNYRNRQYLRAGSDIANAQTLSFKGDGETQTFSVALPIALAPTITVNGVSKTVGIRSVETGFDWYWQKNDKTISQDSAGTKLTSSDTLAVAYQGYYPVMVVSEDSTQINARKAIEGGDGIYEAISEKASIDTQEAALEYSAGLLRRYANISTTITLDTFTEYTAGQLVNVNIAAHGINEDMLVSSVNVTTMGADADMRLVYSVKLVSGESFGGWVQFFKKLVDSGQTFSIRENEVILKLSVFNDSFHLPVVVDDGITVNLHDYQMCGTNTMVGVFSV